MADGDQQKPDLNATTEATNNAAEGLKAAAGAADQAGTSIRLMSDIVDFGNRIINRMSQSIESYKVSINTSGALTDQQAAQFGMLTTSILQTRKAFDNLGGIDSSKFRTYKDQIQDFRQSIETSPLFTSVSDQVAGFSQVLVNLGRPINEVKNAAKKGLDGLSKYANSFLEGADNGLRLQNVMIQLGAKTGMLGNIYRVAGDDLGNINSLMAEQNMIMAETVKATGLSENQVEQYYLALGSVPKALQQNVSGLKDTNSSTNMLTASIKLATGTGQNYQEVISNLHTAFRDFGIAGEPALRFTSRFSEISNKFGIEMSDVQANLLGAAGSFKTMVDAGLPAERMTEGLSEIMNQYIDGLMKTGMTGERAAKVTKDITDSLTGLSTAQKAFLSAQTGGPGGLMGAAQIERMIRDGDTVGLLKKVRSTMEKQFGNIVTLADAEKSESAASQLEKQRIMLQRGPLGSLVKSNQDADRFLEMMKAQKMGTLPTTELDPLGLQSAMDRGTEIQKKSMTPIQAFNAEMAGLRKSADISALNVVQKSFAAGTGTPDFMGKDSEKQAEMRQKLSQQMIQGTERGGQINQSVNLQLEQQDAEAAALANRDAVGRSFANNVNNIADLSENSMSFMQAPIDALKQMFREDSQVTKEDQMAALKNQIAATPNATAGQAVGRAHRLDKIPTTGGAAQNIPPADVLVNQEGATGRIKVQVNVKVLEDGGQAAAINPAYN